MKSNNLLTVLLYALLLGLIVVGGYKACEMRKEKAELAKQDAEMKKYWSDMGSPAADSANAGRSSYSSTDTSVQTHSTAPRSTADANGIEPDEAAQSAAKTPVATTAKKPATTTPTVAPKTTATAAKPTAPKIAAAKPATAKGIAPAGLGNGRYSVRVGSFASVENARSQLEKVIKGGYPNATLGKIKAKDGRELNTVVVFRSNDKAAAIRIMDKLEEKGFDALVHDTKQ